MVETLPSESICIPTKCRAFRNLITPKHARCGGDLMLMEHTVLALSMHVETWVFTRVRYFHLCTQALSPSGASTSILRTYEKVYNLSRMPVQMVLFTLQQPPALILFSFGVH